jgi:hypothetical protein
LTCNILDVTTSNTVYNPTSAQGQWFQHRWGPRQYPQLSVDLKWVKRSVPRDLKYELRCIYGDPICWNELVYFAEWTKVKPEVFTYANTDQQDILHALNRMGCYTVISLDGVGDLCGKVNLGASWDNVQRSIDAISGCGAVEMHTFEHNLHQLPELYKICKNHDIQLFLNCDTRNDKFGTSVIDSKCNWLYDVKPCDTGIHAVNDNNIELLQADAYTDTESVFLDKNLWAFTSLRTYMPVSRHRNILENPLLGNTEIPTEIKMKFDTEYESQEGMFVTPDEKILWNHKVYTMYMYLLANDWKLDKNYLEKNKDNVFVLEVLLYAQHLHRDVILQTQ